METIKKKKKPHKMTKKPPPSSSTSTTKTTWCCSFSKRSPELTTLPNKKKPPHHHHANEYYISPQSSTKSGLSLRGKIDPRKILSPGRVSPIDSDPTESRPTLFGPNADLGQAQDSILVADQRDIEERECNGGESEVERECNDDSAAVFDVRLSLKGKNGGGFMVLEANSKVLRENSEVFAGLINECKGQNGYCRIEVPEVENLSVFRHTIELMFEDDVVKKLIKVGAYRVIDILEVSAGIKFKRGVSACLKYLEAVPWTEEEEEKLRRLFTRFKFDDATSKDIFSRLNLNSSTSPQKNLASQLVRSITTCDNAKARSELKPMVKGLLSKSSVYEKDHFVDITKDDLYSLAETCLTTLVTLFQEDSCIIPPEQASKKKTSGKPLIESVSWQVENMTWLIEILLDRQVAEDFVDLWANQKELLEMHGNISPMVRFELSRISAVLFVAMGTRKLQCPAESRVNLLHSWFGPMLLDFGWLQRCRKGLDVRELEEAMGQALLTLPLKQQYSLFMEWFRCFSKHGSGCPNLSQAFQIWWRRSFLRGSESHAIESR